MRSTDPTNARLVRVAGAAGEDDFDRAPLAPPTKYEEPNVGVLYEEKRQRQLTGSGPVVHVWRTLTVREELRVDWQVGDVVIIRPHDQAADLTLTVSAVEDPHSPRGVASDIVLQLDLVA